MHSFTLKGIVRSISRTKGILLMMLGLICLRGTVTAQNLDQFLTVGDSSSWSIRYIIDQLDRFPDINLAYDESKFDLDQIIELNPEKKYTVKELLALINSYTGTKYTLLGNQIALQKLNMKYSLSGYIRDADTGEALIGAIVKVGNSNMGAVTNLYGFYSLTIEAGTYQMQYSYLGYNTEVQQISLTRDIAQRISLTPTASQLDAVIVTEKGQNVNIIQNEMGFNELTSKQIENIPALFGETDVIKVVKLLPGVITASEMSSGFSVRGGNMDQNLMLIDEATVYNSSHLLGLFSTLNNDAVKSVAFHKGSIPSKYGGRLSSVVDVRMKEGNNQKISGKGGISLISSRLTLEAPVVNEKASFMISGRRTYLDAIAKPFSQNLNNTALYFYDFNAKANYRINEKNTFYVSSYLGRDVFKISSGDFKPNFNWGNKTITARWNHIISPRLFSNMTLLHSNYDYLLGLDFEGLQFEWKSGIKDYEVKIDFEYYLNAQNTFQFGFSSTYHIFQPGKVSVLLDNDDNSFSVQKDRAFVHTLYFSNEQKIDNWILGYGLRLNLFHKVGNYDLVYLDNNYDSLRSEHFKTGEIYGLYVTPEIRLASTYLIDKRQSIKIGLTRNVQFLQIASNSLVGTPLDIWFAASPNIKPQKAYQICTGYFRNFRNNKYESSVELYYKYMDDLIDFKDHANLLLNDNLEEELRIGTGNSYGIEFQVKKNQGKINGWISYTLSRSDRHSKDINEGKRYRSTLDRPHNLSIVGNYQIAKRLSFSANWIYYSGLPFTVPTGRYKYGDSLIPSYSDKNGDRLPEYHRLDLGLTLKKKQKRNTRYHSEWNISVYNVYNRKNTAMISFETREASNNSEIIKYSLFPIIPTISWNFEF